MMDTDKIAEARQTLTDALTEDPGLRQAYQSDIAMCIYDSSLLSNEVCNILADQIVRCVFDVGVSTGNLLEENHETNN